MTPICKYVGKHATMMVGTAINKMDRDNAFLRPKISPIKPKINAPNGRMNSAAEKVVQLAIIDNVGFEEGKKMELKRLAKMPYKVKS